MKLSEKLSQDRECDFTSELEGYAEHARDLERQIDEQKSFIANAQKKMDYLALFFTSNGTFSIGRASINLADFEPAYYALNNRFDTNCKRD